jgi:hypothetical protein
MDFTTTKLQISVYFQFSSSYFSWALFASLERRGGEGFGGREIERKLEKSFTFFLESIFYRE